MVRWARLLSGIAGLVLITVGLTPATAGAAPSGCRSGDPLANVRDPKRLHVVSRCATASGVIQTGSRQHDDDLDVFLKPDPGSAKLLNDRNRRSTRNSLLLEIVPADQPGCRPGKPVRFGTCTGANLRAPRSGTHVTVTGPYVLDRDHGWMEIHPVWRFAPS
ncbi:MAG TPA: hypothetical protein VGO87_14245 [Acidimicrobiia bacterium]|jgi:hypothetical protein